MQRCPQLRGIGGPGEAVAAYRAGMAFERITVNPERMVGKPCIRDLRGFSASTHYTIERVCYDGSSVAHFAVTVDAEIAAVATNVAPRWPVITRSLARAVVCNTRGMTPDRTGCTRHP
jgi:hypothetical protein